MHDGARDAPAIATSGPWTRHARRVVYENPWIEVWHDEVTRPDGGPGIYGVVHFRNAARAWSSSTTPTSCCLSVSTATRWMPTRGRSPRVALPPDEEPLDGIRRELREETGVEASTWVEIGRYALSNSITDELGLVWLATGPVPGDGRPRAHRGACGALGALRRGARDDLRRPHHRRRLDHRDPAGGAAPGGGRVTILHVVRVFIGPGGSGGNPLGVFVAGADIAPERRQAVAHDLNFSETVFVDNIHDGIATRTDPHAGRGVAVRRPPHGWDGLAAAESRHRPANLALRRRRRGGLAGWRACAGSGRVRRGCPGPGA